MTRKIIEVLVLFYVITLFAACFLAPILVLTFLVSPWFLCLLFLAPVYVAVVVEMVG